MYKLLIVEDERLIREGIRSFIDWQSLKIDSVETADNAEAALFLCESFCPDIVITDIRMPGSNGVELCKKLREVMSDIQIIFISGYCDKEYLMSAIELQAVSYIEKPIDPAELSEAVKKAVGLIDKKQTGQISLLHSVLNKSNGYKDLLEQNDIALNSICCLAAVESSMPVASSNLLLIEQELNAVFYDKNISYLIDFEGNSLILLLVYGDNKEQFELSYNNTNFWSHIIEAFRKADTISRFVAIGSIQESLDNLNQSYESAVDSLRACCYKGWNNFSFSSENKIAEEYSIDPKLYDDFKIAVKNHMTIKACDILDLIKKDLKENKIVLGYSVKNIYYQLNKCIKEDLSEGDIVKVLDRCRTIDEFHEYIYGCIQQLNQEEQPKEKNSFVVRQIIQYIENNYSDKDLSTQRIADAIFLTPTYISSLFTKKTGKTIGQYIVDYRINKAIEYLSNPQYKIYQISELVGYEDSNYFTKLFKKQTGVKPSEYRQNND